MSDFKELSVMGEICKGHDYFDFAHPRVMEDFEVSRVLIFVVPMLYPRK